MPQKTTADADRFAIRDRLTELIDAAVQANDSEEGPDAQAAAESIMSEFRVERPALNGLTSRNPGTVIRGVMPVGVHGL